MNPEREPTDRRTSPGGTGTEETTDGEAPNLATRATLVFAAPGRLFDALREDPAWIGMLALVVALSMIGAYLIPQEIFLEAALDQMPAEMSREEALQQAEPWVKLRYVTAVLAPIIIVTFLAGLLLFVFNVVLGGQASFEQLFSTAVHSFLIPAVGGLLTVPVIRATGDIQTALSLHLLFPILEEGFLYRLLRSLNVFGLWACVVLGIGVSRMYAGRQVTTAVGTVLGFYLAWAVVLAFLGGLAA